MRKLRRLFFVRSYMFMSGTLHLIHGFIGSGKTTFAKALERRTGALRLTQDEWMIAFHGTNPPEGVIDRFEGRLKGLLWQWARLTLLAGRDVILDYGFWSRASRKAIRGMAGEIGIEPVFYKTSVSREEMLRRTLARTTAMPPGTLVIDENAFNILWPRFEPMGSDEKTLEF